MSASDDHVSTNGIKQKKKLVLNAFVEMCSGHQSPGLWRHPDDQSRDFNSVKHWVELARTLEAGKFQGMFIADVLGGYDVYGGPENLAPVIMQAGTSRAGRAFAARHAEAVFVSAHTPAGVRGAVEEIRAKAGEGGRDGGRIRVLAKFCPILGRTGEEAEGKYRDYVRYGDREGALALFGGWTGVDMAPYGEDEELRYVESNAIRSYVEGLIRHAPDVNGGKWTKRTLAEHIVVGGLGAMSVGTAETVADEMERWVAEGDVDGFNITYAIMPQTFTNVIELLIPELQRRGIFWTDFAVPGGTYRENLFEAPGQSEPFPDHPAAKMIWRPSSESVGSSTGGHDVRANGKMDYEEPLDDADRIDPTTMQLG